MSTARRSAPAQPGIWPGDHAGRPLVVDVRSLPPLPVQTPAPLPQARYAHDPGEHGHELAYEPAHEHAYEPGADGPREPTFDELLHGYGRHRGATAAARRGVFGLAGSARRASGRRA